MMMMMMMMVVGISVSESEKKEQEIQAWKKRKKILPTETSKKDQTSQGYTYSDLINGHQTMCVGKNHNNTKTRRNKNKSSR